MNKKFLTRTGSRLLNELRDNRIVYILLGFILAFGLFVRVYRLDQLLGFYFDQGRDALVVWKFWHEGKFFLIGPVTGIEGVFRGPWYYWLIAPFYLLGRGDPVWPAVFLTITSVLAIAFVFRLGVELQNRFTGLLAATIVAFSYYLVLASRWLSNPTPMLLISVLLVYSMFKVLEGRRVFWISTAFLLGMAMQFGSAAEVFYFPAVLLFAFWQRDKLPNRKILVLSLVFFLTTLLPQVLFDLRHNGVLRSAINGFLFEERSFKVSFWEILQVRLPFYFDVFSSKLFPSDPKYGNFFFLVIIASFLVGLKHFSKDKRFITIALLFVSPLVGMLFFQGNYGNVYDYYFTGYYLIFVLLFSTLIASLQRNVFGRIAIVIFLFLFLRPNTILIRNYLTSGVDGQTTVAFGNQKQAIDWLYQDLGHSCPNFNVDVYVPPVIPHAYDYLFEWLGSTKYVCRPVAEKADLLYTLYEVDPPHPGRLKAWLERQKTIAGIEERIGFGGITVERRRRFEK